MAANGKSMSPEEEAVMATLYRKFITSCHILHKRNVLDAYGHLSVRHPFHSDRFIMSRYVAPGTISSREDLIEYWVENAEPVDPNSVKGYSERCIHSELYKAYPDVTTVCHSHTEAVTPYSFSGVPFRACTHMAGFLSDKPAPVWDIQTAYKPGDAQDLLVSKQHLGASLAKAFDPENTGKAAKTMVLMRGHGLTIVAQRMEDVVKRCIYTLNNAAMLTTALLTRSAFGGDLPPIRFLNTDEAEAASGRNILTAMRPWKLWVREVEADPLYVNHG